MNPPHPFADAGHPAQPQVLLVDDDEVTMLLTSLALTERGFRVTEAGSGEQALALLHDWTPDLVVLDAMMPGLDGFETCRALRQNVRQVSHPRPDFQNRIIPRDLRSVGDALQEARVGEKMLTPFFARS